MSDNTKSIIFTLILCVACSLMLTTASTSLKPIQEKNIILNMQQNIIKAAGLVKDGEPLDKEITAKLFMEQIIEASLDTDKQKLNFYLIYNKSKEIIGYILPLESKGLWGKIYGYIALKKDGKTVSGVSIYQHQETPGLGGEIDKSKFLNDFKNKLILSENNEFTGIEIAKGKASNSIPKDKQKHYVDGISGATLTGKYLSEGLVLTLKEFEPVSKKFRNKDFNFHKNSEYTGD